MSSTWETLSYSIFVDWFPDRKPSFQVLTIDASRFTDLEGQEIGITLAELAINAGILGDPLVKENGPIDSIALFRNGTYEDRATGSSLRGIDTKTYMMDPIPRAFYERLILEAQKNNVASHDLTSG